MGIATTAYVNHLLGAQGTWTPSITFATSGDLAVTYAADSQIGSYQRIGNFVTVHFAMVTSSFGYATASGDLRITGLPFTPTGIAGTARTYRGMLNEWTGITTTFTQIDTNVQTAGYITCVGSVGVSTAGNANIGSSNMPSGGSVNLRGSAQYEIA